MYELVGGRRVRQSGECGGLHRGVTVPAIDPEAPHVVLVRDGTGWGAGSRRLRLVRRSQDQVGDGHGAQRAARTTRRSSAATRCWHWDGRSARSLSPLGSASRHRGPIAPAPKPAIIGPLPPRSIEIQRFHRDHSRLLPKPEDRGINEQYASRCGVLVKDGVVLRADSDARRNRRRGPCYRKSEGPPRRSCKSLGDGLMGDCRANPPGAGPICQRDP